MGARVLTAMVRNSSFWSSSSATRAWNMPGSWRTPWIWYFTAHQSIDGADTIDRGHGFPGVGGEFDERLLRGPGAPVGVERESADGGPAHLRRRIGHLLGERRHRRLIEDRLREGFRSRGTHVRVTGIE